MIKLVNANGLHFVGKFNDLIIQLAAIKDKNITLKEYIQNYKTMLN